MRNKWMKIIEVLNMSGQPIYLIGLTDETLSSMYLKRVKFLRKITLFCWPHIFIYALLVSGFTFVHLSIWDFITYGISGLVMLDIYFWSAYHCIYFGFLCFFIVSYYCKFRLNAFNSKLNQMNSDLFISQDKNIENFERI